VPGGTWTTSNAGIATVSGGLVTGVTAGSVTISYSVSNSCGTRSASHSVTVVPESQCHVLVGSTSVADEIRIYPNPATTMLKIDAPVHVNAIVLGVDGKLLINEKDVTSIDISRLANGLYFINIYDANDVLLKTAKFAKSE
jgi:hypothetical protein